MIAAVHSRPAIVPFSRNMCFNDHARNHIVTRADGMLKTAKTYAIIFMCEYIQVDTGCFNGK